MLSNNIWYNAFMFLVLGVSVGFIITTFVLRQITLRGAPKPPPPHVRPPYGSNPIALVLSPSYARELDLEAQVELKMCDLPMAGTVYSRLERYFGVKVYILPLHDNRFVACYSQQELNATLETYKRKFV